jgi:response regulator RpfG family c-di-GMP phosphodiesterase
VDLTYPPEAESFRQEIREWLEVHAHKGEHRPYDTITVADDEEWQADPPQLDCCDLLSEIKAFKHTQNIRDMMLVHGSSAEPTRGLDLGADDALSLPLDSAELLSRIRSQLRSKQIADELWEQLRLTEDSQNTNQQLVTAVNEERRTFLTGAIAIVLVLIIVGLVSLSFYRRSYVENV